jgi:transcriptional regulator NrdR family protein
LVQRKTAVEAFSKETLLLSVYEACRHRKTATKDATALTSTILGKLLPQIHQATLTREQIIGATSKVLKNFDKAAHTAYLAYHPV